MKLPFSQDVLSARCQTSGNIWPFSTVTAPPPLPAANGGEQMEEEPYPGASGGTGGAKVKSGSFLYASADSHQRSSIRGGSWGELSQISPVLLSHSDPGLCLSGLVKGDGASLPSARWGWNCYLTPGRAFQGQQQPELQHFSPFALPPLPAPAT